ncbi:hypothetical protein AAVH_17907 [Aphelenchoides avenae]|nr:hypothetical protein AAVH_17907 [Aphelenchus avenae]
MSSVPSEVLRDVLLPLNRKKLDVVQFTNRRFLRLILERMADVCLRQIKAASFRASDDTSYATIRIGGRPEQVIQTGHQDNAHLLSEFLQALRSSRVVRLSFSGLVFTPELAALVLQTPVVTLELNIFAGSCAQLTPTHFRELVLHFSPSSLRINTCHLHSSQITDDFLKVLSKNHVRSTWVHELAPVDGGRFGVSDDAIVDFCVQEDPPAGQEGEDAPRPYDPFGDLIVCNGNFTKDLIKRLVEASAVSMRRKPIRIRVSPVPFEEEDLRDYAQYLTAGSSEQPRQWRAYDFPREQCGASTAMDLQIMLHAEHGLEMIRGYPDFYPETDE